MADAELSALVVCICVSAKCCQQRYRSSSGILSQGAFVTRQAFKHHQYRDRDLLLDEPLTCDPSKFAMAEVGDRPPRARAQYGFQDGLASLESIMSTIDYSAPLEFYHPPNPNHRYLRFDPSCDSDEGGPYRLTLAKTNFDFLNARATVSKLSRVPAHDNLIVKTQLFSRHLSDWKSREWSRQCARTHRYRLLKAVGVSIYGNSKSL